MASRHDADEIDRFKREIDLQVYAATLGYEKDRRESWSGSTVMRHANGDKIFIKRNINDHYLYYSFRDEADNGTIIDFDQKRNGGTLGEVRNRLRDWGLYGKGRKAAQALPLFKPLRPTAKDRLEVERRFRLMNWLERHAWLEDVRCIPLDVLAADRFAGRIRTDWRGNVVFPHFDQDGLCGYEIKNAGFTGFAKGGTKGLWVSHTQKDDGRLVICEAAIDALSYAALFEDGRTRYASIGGEMNPKQPALIALMLERLPAGCEVVAATDNDRFDGDPSRKDTGLELAQVIEALVQASARTDVRFRMHRPDFVKDWNDVLRARQFSSPSYCQNCCEVE